MIYTLFYRTVDNIDCDVNRIPVKQAVVIDHCRYWFDLKHYLAKIGCTMDQIEMVLYEFFFTIPEDNREPGYLALKDGCDKIDFKFNDGTGLTVVKHQFIKVIHQKDDT